MNRRISFRTAALLLLSFSFTAFSLNGSEYIKSMIARMVPPGAMMPVAQTGKMLAKTTSGTKDTLLVSRSDNYLWTGDGWELSDYDVFSYDQTGRPSQTATYLSDDSLTEKMIYLYEPDGRTLRMTSTMGAYSTLYGNDTMIIVASFYPSIISYVPDFSSGIFPTAISDELAMITGLDSMITIEMVRDKVSSEYDTIYNSTIRYSKINDDSIVAAITMSSSAFGTDGPFDYLTTYSFAESALSDTLTADIIIDSTIQNSYTQIFAAMDQMVMISNKDQHGRVIEQIMKMGTEGSILGETQSKYLTSYSASGTVASVISQEWDTLTAAWINTMKNVYTFTPVTLSARAGTARQLPIRSDISAVWKSHSVTLSPARGVSIISATAFDLNGRVMSRVEGNSLTSAGGAVSLPLNGPKNMIAVVRVSTDRGVWVFRETAGE